MQKNVGIRDGYEETYGHDIIWRRCRGVEMRPKAPKTHICLEGSVVNVELPGFGPLAVRKALDGAGEPYTKIPYRRHGRTSLAKAELSKVIGAYDLTLSCRDS